MNLFGWLNSPEKRKNRVAIEIDKQTGVLEECPVCRDLADKGRDDLLPTADAEAHRRFDSDDPSVAIFAGDREDLLRRLRTVRDGYNFQCTCESTS